MSRKVEKGRCTKMLVRLGSWEDWIPNGIHNLSMQDAEAETSTPVLGQPGLHRNSPSQKAKKEKIRKHIGNSKTSNLFKLGSFRKERKPKTSGKKYKARPVLNPWLPSPHGENGLATSSLSSQLSSL